GLHVGKARVVKLYVVDHVSVGDVDIDVSVIVEIEELCPESQRQKSRTEARLLGHFFKSEIAAIAKERVQFLGEVGHKNIEQPVAVQVGELRSHSCPGISVRVIADAGAVSQVGECSVAVIPVQEVSHQIVGDENIRPSVVIEIAEGDSQPFAGGVG